MGSQCPKGIKHKPSKQLLTNNKLIICESEFRKWVSHYSKIIENAEDSIWLDETFEWPVARAIEREEVIDIQLFNYNKYLSNRLIGTFRMVLQQLVDVGNVKISDCLLDANNVVMRTTLTFELTYNAPDGSVGMWQKGGFEKLKSDELRQPLTEEERNQLNLEKGSRESDSITSSPNQSLKSSKLSLDSKASYGKSPKHSKQMIPSVVKMMMLSSKQRAGDCDDKQSLIDEMETDPMMDAKAAEVASMLAAGGQETLMDDDQRSDSAASTITLSQAIKRPKTKTPNWKLHHESSKISRSVSL
ncbi:hypothetical protein ScPMuIL_005353 [Solemya velum]